MITKICRVCGQEKPETEEYFHKSKTHSGGFTTICKSCKIEYDKEYYSRNKERINAQGKLWRVSNKQYRRNKRLEKFYGCDQATYDRFFEKQGGVCAICGKKETRVAKGSLCSLAVDHDHETGEIRGLLCYHCNLALGHFKDSIEMLYEAANYLEKAELERLKEKYGS